MQATLKHLSSAPRQTPPYSLRHTIPFRSNTRQPQRSHVNKPRHRHYPRFSTNNSAVSTGGHAWKNNHWPSHYWTQPKLALVNRSHPNHQTSPWMQPTGPSHGS
ncbi:hypothetical protein M758_1G197100 [Ceratodon purpureus]|nr:hypothetical protein M758_1G196800 [Ceratodon purpureus]KAG0630690.1 hypothetical protein M758_1G197100 [Ceratodon purpureus]